MNGTTTKLNFAKHGVHFLEATSIWLDENALEIADPEHSELEERWIRLGFTRQARILTVVYVEKILGERIRIISARKASRAEIEQYNERISHEK